MRILISGGYKTQNIVKAIEKKFQASGDEFLIVEFLDDINGVFAKGDYFDKAIITEQSITREYTISDEAPLRERLNKFVLECKARAKRLSYVFLTYHEEMANIIHEEILPIMNSSAVVYSKPPYYVPFFVTLIVNDVKQIPDDLVFKPAKIIPQMPVEQSTADDEVLEGMDIPDDMGVTIMDSEGFEDIFGDGLDDATRIGDLGEDEGTMMPGFDDEMPNESMEMPGFSDEPQIEGEDAFQNAGEDPFGSYGNNDEGYGNNGFEPSFEGEDSYINVGQDYQGARSGDLPDYTVTDTTEADTAPGFDTESSGPLLGFDDDDYENNDQDENGLYDDYTPNQFEQNDYQPQTFNGQDIPIGGYDQPEDQYAEGFGDSLYGNDNQGVAAPQGYDPAYQNQQQFGNQPEQEYSNGFNPTDYEQTATNNMQQIPSQQAPQQRRRGPGIGIFARGRQTAPPTEVELGSGTIGSKNINKVKDILKPFASRGNSIVVTGCGGCGTSTVAFNLANIIAQIGYTVLLVDMDIDGRSQSYISKYNYDSMDVDGANLMSAVNSSTNMNTHATVVKTGFHLLTMGLATDAAPIEELLHKEKLSRFASVVKTSYNFIIYDIPFKHSVNFLSDIVFMCENLVLVTDASNWGITKTMLAVCNIDSDDMQDVIFSKAQIVFNKYRNLNRLFGLKVRTCADITQAMDRKVIELVGDDIGLQFSRMSIAGIINDDPMFENGWYEDVQYSDTKKGQDIFVDLIESIVLKKH